MRGSLEDGKEVDAAGDGGESHRRARGVMHIVLQYGNLNLNPGKATLMIRAQPWFDPQDTLSDAATEVHVDMVEDSSRRRRGDVRCDVAV